MAVIEFVENYEDLSTDQGFQFKFHCNRCGNGYMSTFVPNNLGVATDLLRAAGGLFGGVLGNMGNAAYNIQRAIGGPAHDNAVHEAVQEVRPLFNQCHRCGTWVCKEVCWNPEKGLCKQDAPILGEEIAASQAQAMAAQIHEAAFSTDQKQGADLTQQRAATCHNCGAAVGSAKFCPECGTPVVQKLTCAECHAEIPAGVKFCPECGTKV
ncbi:MAG: zinc ribbon domain-containing protein [Capsulimonadaceae bacterium]